MEKSLEIRELMRKLNKTVSNMVTKELGKFGFTLPQLFVMKQIGDEPKTIGQISKAVDLSYSTVSGIIDRLEREHYVERIRDEDDRRVVWIKKTAAYQEMMQKVPIFSDRYYTQLFQGLTEAELTTIIQSLQTLITKIEEKVEEKP